jgi:hypothetical protein
MTSFWEVLTVLVGLEISGVLLAILVWTWLGSLSTRKE